MMQSIKKTSSVTFFVLLAMLDIWAVSTQNKALEMLCKPLLMCALVLYYIVRVSKPNFWLISALFFSFLGDVFLLFDTEFFMFGLGSFLVAHLLYIKMTLGFFKSNNLQLFLKAFLPFALFFTGVLFLVLENLGELLIPVIIYGTVIALFGAVASLYAKETKTRASNWLLFGAMLFILSDSGIAINTFYKSSVYLDVAIIVLYLLAQFAICKAVISRNTIPLTDEI